MYTISTFFKLLKRASINPAVSNEEFVNSLLEDIIDAFKIKGKKGEALFFSKTRISDLLRNKSRVPSNLQKIVQRVDCKKITVEIMRGFCEEMIDDALIDKSISMIKGAIDGADNLVAKQKEIIKTETQIEFLSEAFLLAIKTKNTISLGETQNIWRRGANALDLVVGDIFKFGFDNRKKKPEIVVIPVNDTFETRITSQSDNSCHPLVSENTLHGKWLSRMYKCGYSTNVLNGLINNSLSQTATKTINEAYPIGKIASVPHCGRSFYLLAISHFSDSGISHSTKEDIKTSIIRLLEYYNHYGQGYHLYLPLLGTGRSRAGLSLQESFDLIVVTVLENIDKMNGKISIVILPDDKSRVLVNGAEIV